MQTVALVYSTTETQKYMLRDRTDKTWYDIWLGNGVGLLQPQSLHRATRTLKRANHLHPAPVKSPPPAHQSFLHAGFPSTLQSTVSKQ